MIILVPGVEPGDVRWIAMRRENCHRLSEVGVGNSVWLYGYPTSLANDDLDLKTPLLRAGIVAGITKRYQIVLDCPSYFGNSGGLATELVGEDHFGIGVAIKMIPFAEKLYSREFKQVGIRYENSGYSLIEPMDRVFELVDEIKGTPAAT
jgi:hypothetical protein